MAQQEQNENNIDESELLTLINEEKKLLTNQLHTRLKVRYAAGIGISTAIVMRMASLQLDLALSISTFAFIIAIPLFAYLIFSLDEAEHPYIEYVWPRATVFEEEIESMERVLSMLEERTGDMQDVVDEISERYKSRLEKSNARAHKRVVDGLVVGLIVLQPFYGI
jgi:hypothetical protein